MSLDNFRSNESQHDFETGDINVQPFFSISNSDMEVFKKAFNGASYPLKDLNENEQNTFRLINADTKTELPRYADSVYKTADQAIELLKGGNIKELRELLSKTCDAEKIHEVRAIEKVIAQRTGIKVQFAQDSVDISFKTGTSKYDPVKGITVDKEGKVSGWTSYLAGWKWERQSEKDPKPIISKCQELIKHKTVG